MKPFEIHCGNALDVLRTFPNESIQCCVTSPPYWKLRNYGCGDYEIGKEPTIEEYVDKLVEVFSEVKRVLRNDGTFFLNIGDCYQSKDLLGIPWRVAFALQETNWILRCDVVWQKKNCLPESVKDRPTRNHEYVFLFTKSARYYYDADAVREPCKIASLKRMEQKFNADKKRASTSSEQSLNPEQFCHPNGKNRRSVWSINTEPFPGAHFAVMPQRLAETCIKVGTSEYGCCMVCGAPFKRKIEQGEPLIEEMRSCGANSNGDYTGTATKDFKSAGSQNASETKKRILAGMRERKTVDWIQTCNCEHPKISRCKVLDPFCGSGTTGIVAMNLGCNFIGVDLNPTFCQMSEERITKSLGLLNFL